MKQLKKLLLLTATIGYSTYIIPIDNAHFYKAANLHKTQPIGWFDEKRKYDNYDHLTKIDVSYGYGWADRCWDDNGTSAPLLNKTGDYNMLYLTENVPAKPTAQNFAQFLSNARINHEKTNDTFGQLEFHGKFRMHEVNLDIRQNCKHNLFFEGHVPLRDLKIYNVCYLDKSPETGLFSQQTFEWRQFKNQLNKLLEEYCLKPVCQGYSKTSFGGVSVLFGWQDFFVSENKCLDNFGVMLKGGVLFPNGEPKNTDNVFSHSTSYNNHWGIPLACQFDVTIKKHLTITGHASALLFFNKTIDARMKTHSKQNGLIKLALGKAVEDKGNLWHLGIDATLDHFYKGLSLLVGYSYNREESDYLTPKCNPGCISSCCSAESMWCPSLFDCNTVNTDKELNAWNMHVIHFMLDYDFSHHRQNKLWAPRLNLFYNWPVKGKNAYMTNVLGGGLGLDIRWKI